MKTLFEGFAFDASQSPPIYCGQSIVVVDSDLHHYIEGVLRAVVSVEHAPEYVATGWVADIGPNNQDLKALRAMHNPVEPKPAAKITGDGIPKSAKYLIKSRR